MEIIKSRAVLSGVSQQMGLGISYNDMLDKVKVTQVDATEILKILVTDTDPLRAKMIAENIANVFIEKITQILNVDNVEIIDMPIVENHPINDRGIMNLAISGVLGIMIGIFIVFLKEYHDRNIETETDVEKYMAMNLLGTIPDYSKELKRRSV